MRVRWTPQRRRGARALRRAVSGAGRRGALVIAAALVAPGVAWAQGRAGGDGAAASAVDPQIAAILLLFIFFVVAVSFAYTFHVHGNYVRLLDKMGGQHDGVDPTSPDSALAYNSHRLGVIDRLRASPGGLPDGTIRAFIAIVIVTAGIGALMFRERLGLNDVADITGILGVILGFYFGTRQNAETTEIMRDANKQIVETARRITGQQQETQVATAKAQASEAERRKAETERNVAEESASSANARATEAEAANAALRGQVVAEERQLVADVEAAAAALPEGSGVRAALAGAVEAIGPSLGKGGTEGPLSPAEVAARLRATLGASLPALLSTRLSTASAVDAEQRTQVGAELSKELGQIAFGPLVGEIVTAFAAAARHGPKTLARLRARACNRPMTSDLMPSVPPAVNDVEALIVTSGRLEGGLAAAALGRAADQATRAAFLEAAAQAIPAADLDSPPIRDFVQAGNGALRFFSTEAEAAAALEELRRAVVDEAIDKALPDVAPPPSALLARLDRLAEVPLVADVLTDLVAAVGAMLDAKLDVAAILAPAAAGAGVQQEAPDAA
jgi:hypothetical protein